MCDGNNNVIKSQFPPHAIMRTGQDPIILMGWRNWRNYITFTETGRPYMYFWPANFQQNILPPCPQRGAISVIDNETASIMNASSTSRGGGGNS